MHAQYDLNLPLANVRLTIHLINGFLHLDEDLTRYSFLFNQFPKAMNNFVLIPENDVNLLMNSIKTTSPSVDFSRLIPVFIFSYSWLNLSFDFS